MKELNTTRKNKYNKKEKQHVKSWIRIELTVRLVQSLFG